MDYFESRRRNELIRRREAEGMVADSMEVRRALMQRVHSGEIALEEAQAELKRIKRGAKRGGQVTRAQVWRGQ